MGIEAARFTDDLGDDGRHGRCWATQEGCSGVSGTNVEAAAAAPQLRVRQLAGKIVRLWTTRDASGGVGVSVGTTNTTGLPSRPFQGLRNTFAQLPGPEHREGLIIEIEDLKGFCEDVRST